MGIYARRFLLLFLGRLAWILALVTLFLVLTTFFGFLSRHPYVPIAAIAAGLPDLLLLLLPISLPFSTLLAALWFIRDVRRQRGFLWIHLSGRDPRRYQIPILLAVLAIALLSRPLYSTVLPRIRLSTRSLQSTVGDQAQSLAIRLTEDPDFLGGFRAGFAGTEGQALTGFHLLSGGMALTGRRAEFSLTDDGTFFVLSLADGRLLRLDDESRLDLNARFDHLELRIDARELRGPPLTSLRSLGYYTDAETALLTEQIRTMFRRGIRPTTAQRRRAGGGAAMRAMRTQAAFMPFLAVLVVVVFLGVHRPGGAGRGTAAVVLFCLGILLPSGIALDVAARDGHLPGPGWCFLPSLLVLSAVGLRFGQEALTLRRRRSR